VTGKALVTGGAGFIGSHLCELLLDEGWEVFALDNLSTGEEANIFHLREREGFHLVVDSVLSPAVVSELVHRCDVVYHLAAAVGVRLIVEQPVLTMVTNVRGTETVLEYCERFDKRVLMLWSAVFVLTHVMFYLWILPAQRMHLHDFTGSTFSIVMLLSLLGAFVHETGHASALVSSGCTQTEIGFGLYIYYPVLYTDVSEAWKLPRYRRALIDAGGVYFQSVFQLLLLGVFFINGSSVFIYFFLFNDLIMFRTMNPFLRMDGYWLVADLFGIFNLREQSTKLIQHFVLKLFGSARATQTPLQKLQPRTRVALAVYSLLSVTFFFYISAIMIRVLIVYMVPTYPTRLLAVWEATQAQPFNLLRLLSLIFEVLWRTAVLCGLSIFVYRITKNLLGLVKFLGQILIRKFRRVFALKEQGASSS